MNYPGSRSIFSPIELQNFGHDISEKGTTPNLKTSNFKDFDNQIVSKEVIDKVEHKSALIFELGLLLNCHFSHFCQKLEKNSQKLVGQIVSQIRLMNYRPYIKQQLMWWAGTNPLVRVYNNNTLQCDRNQQSLYLLIFYNTSNIKLPSSNMFLHFFNSFYRTEYIDFLLDSLVKLIQLSLTFHRSSSSVDSNHHNQTDNHNTHVHILHVFILIMVSKIN